MIKQKKGAAEKSGLKSEKKVAEGIEDMKLKELSKV